MKSHEITQEELEQIDINDWIKNHEVHKDRLTPAHHHGSGHLQWFADPQFCRFSHLRIDFRKQEKSTNFSTVPES